MKRFFFSLFKIKFDIDRPINVSKDFAKQIKNKIKNHKFDAVVVSDTYLASYLNIKKPIFVYTDVCFSTYYSHYFNDLKISHATKTEGNICEKLTLSKSKKIILTSKWAINQCSKYYKINKIKFEYLPLGANIIEIPKKSIYLTIIKKF